MRYARNEVTPRLYSSMAYLCTLILTLILLITQNQQKKAGNTTRKRKNKHIITAVSMVRAYSSTAVVAVLIVDYNTAKSSRTSTCYSYKQVVYGWYTYCCCRFVILYRGWELCRNDNVVIVIDKPLNTRTSTTGGIRISQVRAPGTRVNNLQRKKLIAMHADAREK